jgi:pantoate--beta-alanine ligase
MITFRSISEYSIFYKNNLLKKNIGFVPTMGFLHEGHLSLIKKSLLENDFTIVSIFVNPTQFSVNEDFMNYPKDIERDQNLLREINVDALFIPEKNDIYPTNENIIDIHINKTFNDKLCARYRKNHFQGVATIIIKLFSIIKPDIAYFGKKDYQQFILIKNLSKHFFPNIRIDALETIRESSGLAMSSRNSYLSKDEKILASNIYNSLLLISNNIKKHKTINLTENFNIFSKELNNFSDFFNIQYLEIYDVELNRIQEYKENKTFIGTAVFFKDVRLIDNIIF